MTAAGWIVCALLSLQASTFQVEGGGDRFSLSMRELDLARMTTATTRDHGVGTSMSIHKNAGAGLIELGKRNSFRAPNIATSSAYNKKTVSRLAILSFQKLTRRSKPVDLNGLRAIENFFVANTENDGANRRVQSGITNVGTFDSDTVERQATMAFHKLTSRI